jgi:hypothetical protein
MNIQSNILAEGLKLRRFIAKESPTILTFIGVSGFATTVVMAVTATPKALDLIAREEYTQAELHNISGDIPSLSRKEKIKVAWKCYIPAAAVGLATIACIVGSNSINLRRNAALGAIYTLAEATLKEYQEKVIETIGRNKEEKIRGEIDQDRLNKNPLSGNQVIITGKGESLFYDSLSGRYFKSDMETIRRVQNDFNRDLLSEMYKTVNEFYGEIGLADTVMGMSTGWTVDRGMLDVHFSAKLADDGTPCVVIDYTIRPVQL